MKGLWIEKTNAWEGMKVQSADRGKLKNNM